MANCYLTTFDNPYDPFNDFDNWYSFDESSGYHSSEYLARIANTSDALTDEENDQEIEQAIDSIVRLDFMNVYKKVMKNNEH